MQALILAGIVASMTIVYIATTLHLPGLVKLAPEVIAALAIPYIVAAGSRQRFEFVQGKYWAVFALLVFSMISGLLINSVDAGPAIAGLRTYLRVVPLFLIPAIWQASDSQISQWLRWVLTLALLQVPLASWQRWQVWSQGRFTGDLVTGSLSDSGILSIFLICSVIVLAGMLLRRRIPGSLFAALFFLLLVPTTINETKATAILLPLGLLVTFFIGSAPGKRLRVVGTAVALLACFAAIFIPVYNLMQTRNPYAKDITAFFTDGEQLDRYLEAKRAGVGTSEQVGRMDALRIPVQYVADDPVRLVFGLGIGNSSESALGKAFTGRYAELFARITITSFSTFVLELGILGTALVFVLYAMVFGDALFVARHDDGIVGALAVGWTGVTAVMAISTIYANVHVFDSLSILFWLLSGLCAARRAQLGRQFPATVRHEGRAAFTAPRAPGVAS